MIGRLSPLQPHDVELQDVGLAAEEGADVGRRPPEVAVDELLDVGARLRREVEEEEARAEDLRLHRVHGALAHRLRAAVEDAERRLLLELQLTGARERGDVGGAVRLRELARPPQG